jgi:hypothetical protein
MAGPPSKKDGEDHRMPCLRREHQETNDQLRDAGPWGVAYLADAVVGRVGGAHEVDLRVRHPPCLDPRKGRQVRRSNQAYTHPHPKWPTHS